MARVVHGETMHIDRAGRWVARAAYLATADELVPIGVEVRPYLPGQGIAVDWGPLPDDIDPALLPPGGLPLAVLREIEWVDRDQGQRTPVADLLGDLYALDPDAVLDHLERVANEAVRRGMLRAGRRDLTRSTFALVVSTPDAYWPPAPPTRQQTVERVRRYYTDFDENELRATLQWGRAHDPPLFTTFGHGRGGGTLTKYAERILELADPVDSLDSRIRRAVLRQRDPDSPLDDDQ